MMRKCTKCGRLLDENEFNWKFKNIKRSFHCKDCSREYIRSHYERNQKYYVAKARKRDKAIKEKIHEYLAQYFLLHPCVDCGETDIRVLEFDHKERSSKIGEVSQLIKRGLSLELIKSEVAKCEVRCANCHRKKTIFEDNSWKQKYAPVA